MFAGLLTKVGVYAILRMQTLLFPDSPLTDLLLWAALLTMIIGILGAIAQSDIKRMLSFTLVSHIGYLILGIALDSRTGTAGTTFYVVHHITIQTALFLVLGLVERRAGSTALMRIGGLARIAPVLAVLFFVPAMNLAGIPPFSGFIGKVGLFQAAQLDGSPLAWTLVAAGAATSLLTLYAVAKTWAVAFWRTPREAHEALEAIGETVGGAATEPVPGHDTRAVHQHRGHVHTAAGTVSRRDIEEARRLGDDNEPDRDFFTADRGGRRQPPLPPRHAAAGGRPRRGQRAAVRDRRAALRAGRPGRGRPARAHPLPLLRPDRGAPVSPVMRTRRDGSTRPARHRAVQPLAVVWLLLVWLALWGAVTPLLARRGRARRGARVRRVPAAPHRPRLHGAAPAPARGHRPLPPRRRCGRASRWPASSCGRRPVRNAVVAVDLETKSDFMMTLVASMLSLIPGSVVVEARRSTHTLYLHVIDVPDAEAADEFRRTALDLEQRLLRALPPRPTDREDP